MPIPIVYHVPPEHRTQGQPPAQSPLIDKRRSGLVEGRHIDHTTFNNFRTRFHQPLKDLFKQIGRIAMTLGLIRLGEVGFDATRVKANNSRFATRTAKTLEEKLQALDELFEHLASQLNQADEEDLGDRRTKQECQVNWQRPNSGGSGSKRR